MNEVFFNSYCESSGSISLTLLLVLRFGKVEVPETV
jgi:hypothetical protein